MHIGTTPRSYFCLAYWWQIEKNLRRGGAGNFGFLFFSFPFFGVFLRTASPRSTAQAKQSRPFCVLTYTCIDLAWGGHKEGHRATEHLRRKETQNLTVSFLFSLFLSSSFWGKGAAAKRASVYILLSAFSSSSLFTVTGNAPVFLLFITMYERYEERTKE